MNDKLDEGEVVKVNLFNFLAERLIKKLEEQPILVEFRFADGSRTVEITKKHRWFKELSRRRAEEIKLLRSKLALGSSNGEGKTKFGFDSDSFSQASPLDTGPPLASRACGSREPAKHGNFNASEQADRPTLRRIARFLQEGPRP